MGTVVNQTLPSLHKGSFKITKWQGLKYSDKFAILLIQILKLSLYLYQPQFQFNQKEV